MRFRNITFNEEELKKLTKSQVEKRFGGDKTRLRLALTKWESLNPPKDIPEEKKEAKGK